MKLRSSCTFIVSTANVHFTYVLLNLEVARCPFIAATNGASSSSTLSSRTCASTPHGRSTALCRRNTALRWPCTNLRYFYFTWVFLFYATLYCYSTTSQKQILYFLLHYICLTALVALQITIFHTLPVQWKPCFSKCGDFECEFFR